MLVVVAVLHGQVAQVHKVKVDWVAAEPQDFRLQQEHLEQVEGVAEEFI